MDEKKRKEVGVGWGGGGTDVNQPNALLVLQKVQRQCDVLELLGAKVGSTIDAFELSATQHFDKCEQSQPVAEVRCKIAELLVRLFYTTTTAF